MTSLIVDLFCGGGGASEGIRLALGRDPDVAVNHDDEAVAMHLANHPTTRHHCGNVWDVDPFRVVGARAVDFRADYAIAPTVNGAPLTKTAQIRMCGNSVPPQLVAAIVGANVPRRRTEAA